MQPAAQATIPQPPGDTAATRWCGSDRLSDFCAQPSAFRQSAFRLFLRAFRFLSSPYLQALFSRTPSNIRSVATDDMARTTQPHPIDALLNERGIRKQAGARVFEAGKRLYETGSVRSLGTYDDEVGAMVFAPEPNHARLLVKPGALGLVCTCYDGAVGRFCKHCVATALAWMNRDSDRVVGAGADRAASNGNGSHAAANPIGEITIDDVTAMLMMADKEMLVEMILTQAEANPEFMGALMAATAEVMPGGAFEMETFDLDVIRRDIEETIVPYVPGGRGATGQFAAEIVQLAHDLSALVGTRTDQQKLLDVIEFALERTSLAEVNARGDGLLPALIAMAGAWCGALARIGPTPENLAKRIVAFVLRNESPELFRAIAHCLDMLADDAHAALRAECLTVLNVAQGSPTVLVRYGRNYIRATTLGIFLLEYASAFADTDLALAPLTKNPTAADDFRAIVDVLTDTHRRDDAVSWAERGLAALPVGDCAAMVEFLTAEYKRRGNHVRRAEVMLIDFERSRSLREFAALQTAATKAGTWNTLRERAYEIARGSESGAEHDATLVVEMLLHEQDVEAAWNEAITGGCRHATWMRLASARSATNPRDALAVYQARIDELGGVTDQEAYAEITGILKLAAPLMETVGERFEEYVGELRTQYKRRRTFIALLDEAFREGRTARG